MNIFDFKCKYCGGELEVVEGMKSVGRCIYCGSKQTIPKLESEKRAILFDRANHLRRNNEFDKAESLYEQLLNEDPTDPEAYWSLVLCKYGIEYVEDARTKARIPTVNRMQYTSILADENYKSAIAKASPEQKQLYEEEALTINEIQKGILEIANKEEPFDIFICYKETDENGKRSKESFLAHDLYHELTRQGYKVFFARITLQGKLGVAYEPYIFSALNFSKVMVVLGTQKEHFEAVWVRNEWSRFLGQIKNGEKKILIPAYKDMDAYDLPVEFSHLQALDMSRFGFMYDLIDSINAILKIYKPKETVVEPIYRPTPINHEAEKPAPAPEKKQEPISRPSPTNYETQPKAQPTPIKKVEPISRPNPTNYGTQPKAQPASTKKPSAPSSASAKAADKKKKSNKALIIILIACTVGIIGLLAMLNNNGNPTPENKPVITTPATTVYDGTGTGYVEDTSVIEQETVKEESVGLEYELNDDGDGYFVYKGNCTDTDVVIPAKHKGIRVTGIGSNAFKDYEDLESIIISEGVMFISDSAFFGCTNLTSVTLPNSMANIGVAAFADCTSLKDIVIPNNVYKIDTYAFSGCTALENIYFNGTRAEWNGVIFGYGWDQETGNYTVHCSDDAPEPEITEEESTVVEETTEKETAAVETTTAEETTKFETTAVEETTKFETTTAEETTVEETAEEITSEVDKGSSVGLVYELNEDGDGYSVIGSGTCTDTEIVISSTYNGLPVTSIGNYVFKDCSSLTSITIPDSVTSIGNYVFNGCSSLTSITIPDSITSIGYYVFWDCSSLTSITIPDSVTSIGGWAFYHCSALTSIYFNGTKEQWDSISFGSYWNGYKDNLTVYCVEDEEPMPEDTEAPEETIVEETTVEETTTEAETEKEPTAGLKYELEENSYKVVYSANHSSNTEIVIPATYYGFPVTSIGDYAFDTYVNLTSITISDSITSIGEYAFYYCESLTSIYFNGTKEQWDSITKGFCWDDSTGNYTVYYAKSEAVTGSVGLEYTLNGDSYSVSGIGTCTDKNVVIPAAYNGLPVTSIGIEAFNGCSSLTSITIPDSVTSIGDDAFYKCSSLTSITIPDSVTSIGNYAFSGCRSLTRITIPDSVTSIGNYAFKYCTNLTSITIPDSVTSIGSSAFQYCSSLTSITISNSVISIGDGAFDGCSSLTSITIPDSVTSIGYGAFFGCNSLTSITIPDSVTSIGDAAFHGCSSLTSITIPDSVTSIGSSAFQSCISLTSITIPNSVTSIGDRAFDGCNSLTSITIPDSVTSIGNYTFYGCSSLTSITIPDGVTSIGEEAFRYCTRLTTITIPDSVTSIGNSAFSSCRNLQKIYYGGKTAYEWVDISIAASNENLTNVTIYYYYPDSGSSSIVIPGGPIDTSLRYWYYVDGVVTERPEKWPFVQSPV